VIAGDDPIPFDVAVFCGGFRPSTLAVQAGLACDARGKVLVDATLRSRSHPFVLAAGDCASIDEVVGAPVLDTCKAGMPSGAHAADVLVALVEGRDPARFRFADSVICVAIGRRAGVVDRRRPDGSPAGRVITGRIGAMIKEMICRFTWASIRFEKSGLFAYRWPRNVPSLTLPATERKRLAA
jgi:NADH dehydrogenase FAD-containing subunit